MSKRRLTMKVLYSLEQTDSLTILEFPHVIPRAYVNHTPGGIRFRASRIDPILLLDQYEKFYPHSSRGVVYDFIRCFEVNGMIHLRSNHEILDDENKKRGIVTIQRALEDQNDFYTRAMVMSFLLYDPYINKRNPTKEDKENVELASVIFGKVSKPFDTADEDFTEGKKRFNASYGVDIDELTMIEKIRTSSTIKTQRNKSSSKRWKNSIGSTTNKTKK